MWLYISLLCALSLATTDMLSKKALSYTDESAISFLRFFFCLPPLYVMLYLNGIPELKRGFFLILLLAIPIEVGSMLLYNRAIKLSPLSLTMPFLSFSPVFLIFTAYFMLHELPNAFGLIGILLITLGGYLLNIDLKKGFLYPIKAVLKEKGSILMFVVALLYSITSVLGKIMLEKSDFIFAPTIYFTIVTFLSGIVVLYKKQPLPLKEAFSSKKIYFWIGLFSSITIISHYIALNMVKVEYMISVKRSSMLFGIIYGSLFFKENEIKKRLFGASIMLIGIILIGFFGN